MTINDVYKRVEELFKLANAMNDDNYASAVEFSIQAERADAVRDIAEELGELFARLEAALNEG
jgi:hypothetical protein